MKLTNEHIKHITRSLNIAFLHLQDYLNEFPEHDQGDIRVYLASERIEVLIGILNNTIGIKALEEKEIA